MKVYQLISILLVSKLKSEGASFKFTIDITYHSAFKCQKKWI